MFDLLITGRKLVFESALGHAEVTSRLQREVAPVKWLLIENRKQQFEGTFADGRFSMSRMVRGRNSFRTMMDGRVLPSPSGTRIEATLRLHPVVTIFCAALALFWAMIASLAVSEYVKTGQVSGPLFISGGALLVFCAFLVATVVEARLATRMLARLFEADASRV